ncbi:hypothetical protein ACOJUR_00035 [Alicyclobacillus tolerans]|uniref:hypothetical protein n=1 Tax=Alicyclobacillus tolerans TaxID=90970 RepID=UPI003B78877C
MSTDIKNPNSTRSLTIDGQLVGYRPVEYTRNDGTVVKYTALQVSCGLAQVVNVSITTAKADRLNQWFEAGKFVHIEVKEVRASQNSVNFVAKNVVCEGEVLMNEV